MKKTKPPTDTPAEGTTAAKPAAELRNIAVEALRNRVEIRGAVVAAGRVDFPLTETEAQKLESLGLVRVIGLF